MEENWTLLRQVSRTEEAFAYITKQLPQPVGIILFGADGDLKDDIYQKCVEKIPQLATGYGGKRGSAIRDARKPLGEGRSVLVFLDENSSSSRCQRSHAVMSLRDSGAQTVLGIYVSSMSTQVQPYFLSNDPTGDFRQFEIQRMMSMTAGDQVEIGEFDALFLAPEKITE